MHLRSTRCVEPTLTRLEGSLFGAMLNRSRLQCIVVVIAAFLTAFSNQPSNADTVVSIDVDGAQREYRLHTPAGANAPAPLVMVFHGGGGSAERFQDSNLIHQDALARGYAVVYPDAGDGQWNTYRGSTGDPASDLRFVDAMVNGLVDDGIVDNSRVFATGFSSGGDFSFVLGLTRPDRVSAIAPVGMNLSETLVEVLSNSGLPSPMPTLSIVGTEDPLALFEGGSPNLPGSSEDMLLSSDATLDYLAQINSVQDFITTPFEDIADDETVAFREEYIVGLGSTPLQRIVVEGGGHTWPGGSGRLSGGFLGATSQDFSANVEILNFFDSVTSVPEPSSGLLCTLLAINGLLIRRRRNIIAECN